MQTMKENFLRLMKNDNPTWLGDPWDCFNQNPMFRPCIFDAVTLTGGTAMPGEVGKKDRWGITWDWPPGQPGGAPHITAENKVLKDICAWRDVINFNNLPPDPNMLPWDVCYAMVPPLDRDNLLTMVPSFSGMFEFSHLVMGFEDALVNYLVEPEEMYDLLSAYTDWKIKVIGMVIDKMNPDIIHSHDDWGNKKSLFLNPSVWREMIKPHYERFYGYIKSRGVLIQHHCDCVSQEVCEDMVDLGIDMWQGVIPQNNIKNVIERTEGKLCVMGGFDMQLIDHPDTPEETIRAYVRQVIDDYMPLGSFIPNVTNIFPIYENVTFALNDELNRYGAEYAARHFR